MGDIRIVFDQATFTGDFAMSGNGLELGNELETAVLISLFTDQVADPGDVLPPGQASDPRGWWADTYEGDQIGSRLWQVFWRQTTQDTLNWVRDTATKSLQWMIDDGVATSVTVEPQFIAKGAVGMVVTITEPGGNLTPFTYAWQQEV
jgi:phage gp46-like protein